MIKVGQRYKRTERGIFYIVEVAKVIPPTAKVVVSTHPYCYNGLVYESPMLDDFQRGVEFQGSGEVELLSNQDSPKKE